MAEGEKSEVPAALEESNVAQVVDPPSADDGMLISLYWRNYEAFTNHDFTEPVWKARKGEYLISACLFVTSIVVSIDSTVLVTALPVPLIIQID